MTEQAEQPIQDEVGQARGPQAAAQAALGVAIDGREGDGQAGDQVPPAGEQPVDPLIEWTELLETGFAALFGVASLRWKSLEATEKEIHVLAQAWAPVAVKHAQGTVPIEAVAALATLAVLAPKIRGALQEEKDRKAVKVAAAKAAKSRDPGTEYV